MPPTSATTITPPAAVGMALLVLALCAQVIVAPAVGLPLALLALFVAAALVAAFALGELERDVVHWGLLGAIVAGLAEAALLGRDAWWHGALFGLLVGGLIGDEIQLARKWLRLARHARAETRWWQRQPEDAHWLPGAVWVVGGGLIFVGAGLALVHGPQLAAQTQLHDAWFDVLRERRLANSTWRNLAAVWFAVAPLGMAMALSRFATKVPHQRLLVESILRRVAVLQCAALMMLAADGATRSLANLAEHPRGGTAAVSPLADSIFLSLLPLFILVFSQFFLGRLIGQFWRTSGWIVVVGLCSVASVIGLQFGMAVLLGQVPHG